MLPLISCKMLAKLLNTMGFSWTNYPPFQVLFLPHCPDPCADDPAAHWCLLFPTSESLVQYRATLPYSLQPFPNPHPLKGMSWRAGQKLLDLISDSCFLLVCPCAPPLYLRGTFSYQSLAQASSGVEWSPLSLFPSS